MYVDRGQKEVSKILSDRYMTNFLKTDAMQRQAASLTAAPFEGDEALRAEVLQDTDQFLQAAATAGDYENMTTDVVRAASNYQARVQPIQQNQRLWQEYQAKLDEQVAKGEVPANNAEDLKLLSRMKYQGLQKDADGNVGGYFQGVNAAIDPDVMGMLDEALKGIETESQSQITRVVGVDSEKGMLEVETEAGREFVSMDRVQNVIDPIFADPKVQAFMQQSAELGQIRKSPEQLMQETQTHLEGQKATLEAMESELANTSDDEKKADLQAQIDRQTEGINQTQALLDGGDPDAMARAAAGRQMLQDEVRMREAMGAKYQFDRINQRYEEHRDKLELIKAGKDETMGVVPMTHSGEARSIANPMGTNYEEINNTRAADIAAANEILNFLDESPNLAPEVVAGKRAQLQGHLQDVAVANALLISEFEGNPPEDYNVEEYNSLKQELEDATTKLAEVEAGNVASPGYVQTLRAAMLKVQNVQERLGIFLTGEGLEISGEAQEIVYAPTFSTGVLPGYSVGDKENEAIQAQLVAHWQGNQARTIFMPNSNQTQDIDQRKKDTQAKIAEDPNYVLQDGDIPPAFKVISVGVSVSAPGVGGPVQEITIESTQGPTKGQTVTFTAPGSDINVAQYQEWLNSPATKMTGFIDKMQMVGRASSFTIPTNDSEGDNWQVKVRIVNGERYVTFIDSDGTPSQEYEVGSEMFAKMANQLNMSFNVTDLQ
jgi:hypothetical protein